MTYAEIIFAVTDNKKVFYENKSYQIIRKGNELYMKSIMHNHLTIVEPFAGNLKSYYIEGEELKMKLIDNITLSLARADYTEGDYKDEWKTTANKYKARITYNKKSMTTSFYTGRGWERDPVLEDILGSILQDTTYASYNFNDFASAMGYDPDSRKTEKIYKEVQKQAKKVNRIFSEEEQEELLTYLEKEGKL